MAGSKASQQRRPYRRWPVAEKRRIVELTLREGASARAIAREYGISHNSLCRWKACYRAGTLESTSPGAAGSGADGPPLELVPVVVSRAMQTPRNAGAASSCRSTIVELSLVSGVTMRIEINDTAVLGALIEQLQR